MSVKQKIVLLIISLLTGSMVMVLIPTLKTFTGVSVLINSGSTSCYNTTIDYAKNSVQCSLTSTEDQKNPAKLAPYISYKNNSAPAMVAKETICRNTQLPINFRVECDFKILNYGLSDVLLQTSAFPANTELKFGKVYLPPAEEITINGGLELNNNNLVFNDISLFKPNTLLNDTVCNFVARSNNVGRNARTSTNDIQLGSTPLNNKKRECILTTTSELPPKPFSLRVQIFKADQLIAEQFKTIY